jgi:hypothetical protein
LASEIVAIIEKVNDRLDARRQKYDGRSWGKACSISLFSFTRASVNAAISDWKRMILFSPEFSLESDLTTKSIPFAQMV